MSTGGHKTSAIPRARALRRARQADPTDGTLTSAADRAADRGGARRVLDDLTSPIGVERRLVRRRSNRWLLALAGLAVVGALGVALFVLPVKAWLRQEDDLTVKRQELEVLTKANDDLIEENGRLNTPSGGQEAARDELGVVDEGEERISVLPGGAAPLTLPVGWPYDTVTQIISARAAIAAAPATTTAP
jgi:cell division protein FtsB